MKNQADGRFAPMRTELQTREFRYGNALDLRFVLTVRCLANIGVVILWRFNLVSAGCVPLLRDCTQASSSAYGAVKNTA